MRSLSTRMLGALALVSAWLSVGFVQAGDGPVRESPKAVELVLPPGFVPPAGPPAPAAEPTGGHRQGATGPDSAVAGPPNPGTVPAEVNDSGTPAAKNADAPVSAATQTRNESRDAAGAATTEGKAVSPTVPASEKRGVFPDGASKAAEKPGLRVEATPSSTLMSTVLPLASVLGLALACAWVVRKCVSRDGALSAALGGGKAPAGILEVLGRYPLARGQTLILLRLDRRVLLLSQSSGSRNAAPGVTTLAEVSDPEDVASILGKVEDAEGRSMAKHFQALLSRVRDGQDVPEEPEQDGGFGARRRQLTAEGDAAEFWPEAEPPVMEAMPVAKPADPVAALRARLAALGSGERAA